MNITFRTQLLDGVTGLCTECDFDLSKPEILVDLIVRLARYREEGTKLAPQVYLTDNMDLIMKLLPGGEKIQLSASTPDADGIEEMLKLCAPLAIGEWRIFGCNVENKMNFGVFRGSNNPISVSVDQTVLSEQTEATVIKAHQVAEECVQVRTSKGHHHHIFFNHRKEDNPTPLQFVDSLVDSVVRKVDDDAKDAVQGLVAKTAHSALVNSHGCLLAVTNMFKPPKALSHDAVILEQPIDFPLMIREFKREEGTSDWLQHIEKKAQLVEGMINCDGITLFDQFGRLLAYRCFIQLPKDNTVVGGARRRAFEALKARLGKGLCAAFIRSEDGWTDFRSVADG